MIAEIPRGPSRPVLVVVDVGNTNTALGLWDDCVVSEVVRVPTAHVAAFRPALEALCLPLDQGRPTAVAIGSVVPDALSCVSASVRELLEIDARVVGADVPLPIPVQVRSRETVGVDRVCMAAAAFEKTRHACTVVSFGSAITVDMVGDEGAFLGGAILPGARMQARALNTFTAALPEIDVRFPRGPIGDDTEGAIQSGVLYGITGAVRGLVEAFATVVGKWPQVVATGGDLELFLPHCDFLETPVPDLCLMGVGLAVARQDLAGS